MSSLPKHPKSKHPKSKHQKSKHPKSKHPKSKHPKSKHLHEGLIRNPRGPPTSGIKEKNFKERISVQKKIQTNTDLFLEESIKDMTSKMDCICEHLQMFLSQTDNKQLTKGRKCKFYKDYPVDAIFLKLNGFNIYIFISLYPKLFTFDKLSNNMKLIQKEEKHLFIYCYKCIVLINNTNNQKLTNKTPNYCIWCST